MPKNSIATAWVQILPTTDGIQDNLDKELGGAGEKSGKTAGRRFGASLVKAVAALGIGEALKKTLDIGGELQQNLGGTEAVFGNFSASIQKLAADAYANMGLSASDYMATANKMASLFQGSGLSQKKSFDLTAEAMQRAADVASVMGIDTAAAMESIAGAAKGNFTMMDNLGVAMNATTLSAYALEKGINFDWNTASNAEKAELAIQMFMDRTSDYADNFKKESEETFSGAFAAMAAAAKNFVGDLSTGADITPALEALKETAVTFFRDNFIPAVGNVLTGLGTAITEVLIGADRFKELNAWLREHEGLLKGVAVAAGILTAAVAAYTVSQNLLSIAMGVYSTATGIATAVAGAFGAVMAFITSPITLVTLAIGAVVAAIVVCVNHWDVIKAKVGEVGEFLKGKFGELKTSITAFKDGAVAAWNGFVSTIQSARDKIHGEVEKIKSFFSNLKISLPHIDLPHFKLTGEFSIKPPSVPKISIDWYSKAMNNAMLLTSPTIFGYSNGNYLGGGEAGAEVVAGASTLMGMMRDSVRDELHSLPVERYSPFNAEITQSKESELVDLMHRYLPYLQMLPKLVEVGERDTTLNINNREFARAVKAVG